MGISAMCGEPKCGQEVSVLGSHVKSTGKIYHVECFFKPMKADVAHQAREEERAVTMGVRASYESEMNRRLEEIAILRKRLNQPVQVNKDGLIVAVPAPPPAPAPAPPMPRAEWDTKAEKLINQYIANYGPMFSKQVLYGYLYRLYKLFVNTDLINLVEESKPGPTLEEFFKGTK